MFTYSLNRSDSSFLGKPQPPSSNNQVIMNYNSRFDDTSSSRKEATFNEKLNRSNLGPGVYEHAHDFRNVVPLRPTRVTCLQKTIVPLQSSIVQKARAPPIGTYNIARLMSPSCREGLGQGIHIHTTSSFRSTGKAKDLMFDAKRYQTMRRDVYECNIGPGTYDVTDKWKNLKNRPMTTNSAISSVHAHANMHAYGGGGGGSDDNSNINSRPWRVKETERAPALTSTVGGGSGVGVGAGGSHSRGQLHTSEYEIQEVKMLPNFGM